MAERYYTSSDLWGIIISVGAIIAISIFVRAGIMDFLFGLIISFILAAYPISRGFLTQYLISRFKEKFANRGINDYWNILKEEINRTSQDFGFSINLRLPDTYFPYNHTKFKKYDLYLAEINRNDLLVYSGEWEGYVNFLYEYVTVVLEMGTGKLGATLRGFNLEGAIKFIEEHPDLFGKDEGSRVIIPETIKETTFGTGQVVK